MDRPFGPGTEIQLDLIAANGVCHTHRTTVRDSQPSALVLHAPVENGIAVYVPVGTEVTLWQQEENKAYVATVRVIATRPERPPLIVTTPPSRVDWPPKRHFCRVSTSLPFRAGAVDGEVKDISGNGALVRVPGGAMTLGRAIRAEIALPGLPLPLRMEAKVVRITPSGPDDLVGLTFERVNERVRDHIIRHVFAQQRELQSQRRRD
jgi:c-di-GMP-binding flagellar brake protein YcgR